MSAKRANCTRIDHTWKLLNFIWEIQVTRLLSEEWTKATSAHMGATALGGNNAGLNTSATTFGRSAVVKLIGRPHLDVFQQERLIPPNIDLNIRLILFPNDFV